MDQYSCIKKDNNISILLKISDRCLGVEEEKAKYLSHELIIDSLGNKISETYIKELDKFYLNGMFIASDKTKMLFGEKVVGFLTYPMLKHNIIKLDSLNKVVWNKTYSETVTLFAKSYFGFETKNKDYVVVGTTMQDRKLKGLDVFDYVGSIHQYLRQRQSI
jgi:hypothetical protein